MSDYQRWYECAKCKAFTVRFDDELVTCCGDVREIDREALIAQQFERATRNISRVWMISLDPKESARAVISELGKLKPK